MKYLVAICLLLAASVSKAPAQARPGKPVGGYFDLSFETLSVRGDRGLVTGLGFGLVFNHDLSVGLAGYGLWSSTIRTTTIDLGVANARLHIVWGGLEAEKVLLRLDALRLSLLGFAGVGNVQLPTEAFHAIVNDFKESGLSQRAAGAQEKDQFLFARPMLALHWQADSWIVLTLNCSYKFASGIDYFTMSDADLRGFEVGMRVAIGSF